MSIYGVLIDSYPFANGDNNKQIDILHPSVNILEYSGRGQSFTVRNQCILRCLRVALKKVGNPIADLQARLYTHNGVYGTTSRPLNDVQLAESYTRFPTVALGLGYSITDFWFVNGYEYTLRPNTHYCIAIIARTVTTLNAANYVHVHHDTSAPTHGGNAFFYELPSWQAVGMANTDMCFEVYRYSRGHHRIGYLYSSSIADVARPHYSTLG